MKRKNPLSPLRRSDDQALRDKIAEQYPPDWDMDDIFQKSYAAYLRKPSQPRRIAWRMVSIPAVMVLLLGTALTILPHLEKPPSLPEQTETMTTDETAATESSAEEPEQPPAATLPGSTERLPIASGSAAVTIPSQPVPAEMPVTRPHVSDPHETAPPETEKPDPMTEAIPGTAPFTKPMPESDPFTEKDPETAQFTKPAPATYPSTPESISSDPLLPTPENDADPVESTTTTTTTTTTTNTQTRTEVVL